MQGEIIAKTVFSRDDVVRIYEETEALSLPLDAISEGLFIHLYLIRISLPSL